MPLRRQAEQMRDMYANEIASAVHEGRPPSRMQVAAWARYRDAAVSDDPSVVLSGPHEDVDAE